MNGNLSLLDSCYKTYLKQYDFEHVKDMKQQLVGIDLILTHKSNGKKALVDEKAQLDYVNENLPTFAFELGRQENGIQKKGWLFDASRKTCFFSTTGYCPVFGPILFLDRPVF